MDTIEWNTQEATVRLTLDELDALRNGLNEAQLLLKSDFETRMFISRADARALLESLQALATDMVRAGETQEAPVKNTG
jgi:hypothetical protein